MLKVGALTSHYIASMGFSGLLRGCFAWMAWENLTCEPFFGKDQATGFMHSKWAIGAAHVLHLVILGDFAYTYVRSMVKNGINKTIDFSSSNIQLV